MFSKHPPRKVVTKKHLARQEKEARQIKIIKIGSLAVLAVVLVLFAYAVIDTQIVKPNRVVAQVGDMKLTARQFQQEVKYGRINLINRASQYLEYAQMFGGMGDFLSAAQQIVAQLDSPQTLGEATVNRMIDEVLIHEEATKRGISVSDAEVEEELHTAFGFFPNGTQTPTITPTSYPTATLDATQLALIGPTATLASTPEAESETSVPEETGEPAQEVGDDESPAKAEGTPVPDLTPTSEPTFTPTPTVYTTQIFADNWSTYLSNLKGFGITDTFIRKTFENQLLRSKLMEEITRDIDPLAEQVWARHILVATEDEALKVLDELKAGKDFKELASTYSTDPGSKDNAGDLGWFGKGRMVPEFEEAAFALAKVGDLSQPVQSVHGWHIIQLLGKGKNPVDSQTFQTQKMSFFEDWLKDLRDKRTDITIMDEVWQGITPDMPPFPNTLRQQLYSLMQPQPTQAPLMPPEEVEPVSTATPAAD